MRFPIYVFVYVALVGIISLAILATEKAVGLPISGPLVTGAILGAIFLATIIVYFNSYFLIAEIRDQLENSKRAHK